MAIVRQDVCTGRRTYWHRLAAFPSEPTFVPRPEGSAEDDGVILFTLLDGVHGKSRLMAVDASSMETVSEWPTEMTIGFTTHGEWYESLVDASPHPTL